jgi:hypothetical protein
VKKFLVCIACVFATLLTERSFAAPRGSSVEQQPTAQETLMLFAHQVDDPVRIIQATFGSDNTLLDAQLENKGHQKIQSYRLGWAAVRKDEIRIGRANPVDVPKAVDTTSSFSIPGPENAAKDDLARHPVGIVFYVAELQFEDGKHWQADLKKIKKEAADMVK